MPTTTTTPSTTGGLDLSFIKSLLGSSTSNPTESTTNAPTPTTSRAGSILSQIAIPPSAITTTTPPSQQQQQHIEQLDQQIKQQKSQQSQSHAEHFIENSRLSTKQSSAKQRDPLELSSLLQEQHKRPITEQKLTHDQSNAHVPSPTSSQPPHPPSQQPIRKKEGKRQRVNRLRQKRKTKQHDNFDNNTSTSNDDLDFDGLLALHETEVLNNTKRAQSTKKTANRNQSTTSHSTTLSTTNQSVSASTKHHPNLSPIPLVDQSLETQSMTHQSSAYSTCSPSPMKKSDLSTQDASFLSNLLDSLSKGDNIPTPPPLHQQSNSNQKQVKDGPKGNSNKKQTSTKRKTGQEGSTSKKQKVNSGILNNLQSVNGKPSMTDIAHDILGKARKQPHQQKQGQNHQRNRSGQHQGPSNQQKQHISSLNSNNNKKTPTGPFIPTITCRYYARGNCEQGDNCTFKHDGKQNLTLCKFYKSGSCENGAECSFSHDLELEPCRFFFVRGSCDAGEHCPFSHAPLTDDSRKELHKMTGPCRFYHFKGFCSQGDECLFAHTEIPDDKRNELELTLTPCKYFHTQQVCPKGKNCFYLHEEAPAESVRLFKETLVKQQQQQQQQNQNQTHLHQSGIVNRQPPPTKQLSSKPQLYPSVTQHAPSPPNRPFSNQHTPTPLLSGSPAPPATHHSDSFAPIYRAPGEQLLSRPSSQFDPRLTRPLPLPLSRDPRSSASNHRQQYPSPQNHSNFERQPHNY